MNTLVWIKITRTTCSFIRAMNRVKGAVSNDQEALCKVQRRLL